MKKFSIIAMVCNLLAATSLIVILFYDQETRGLGVAVLALLNFMLFLKNMDIAEKNIDKEIGILQQQIGDLK